MSSSSAGQREKPELEAVHGGADLVFGQWRRFIKENIKAQFYFLTRDMGVVFNFPRAGKILSECVFDLQLLWHRTAFIVKDS